MQGKVSFITITKHFSSIPFTFCTPLHTIHQKIHSTYKWTVTPTYIVFQSNKNSNKLTLLIEATTLEPDTDPKIFHLYETLRHSLNHIVLQFDNTSSAQSFNSSFQSLIISTPFFKHLTTPLPSLITNCLVTLCNATQPFIIPTYTRPTVTLLKITAPGSPVESLQILHAYFCTLQQPLLSPVDNFLHVNNYSIEEYHTAASHLSTSQKVVAIELFRVFRNLAKIFPQCSINAFAEYFAVALLWTNTDLPCNIVNIVRVLITHADEIFSDDSQFILQTSFL